MELNINSPAYYTEKYGIDDEIYSMCKDLRIFLKNNKYSDIINIIGIVPIIAEKNEILKGLWKETKKCELKYGFSSVSLQIDFETYVNADISYKKQLIIENILKSVKVIAKKGRIDYQRFESDVIQFCELNQIELFNKALSQHKVDN